MPLAFVAVLEMSRCFGECKLRGFVICTFDLLQQLARTIAAERGDDLALPRDKDLAVFRGAVGEYRFIQLAALIDLVHQRCSKHGEHAKARDACAW